MHTSIKKTTCVVLSALMTYMPAAVAYADAITDGASEGKSLGQQVQGNWKMPSYNASTRSYTIDGTVDGEAIGLEDLFQDSSGNMNDYTDKYESESGTVLFGEQQQKELLSQDSPTGSAYRTVLETAQSPTPSLNSDPIWGKTADAITNAELTAGFTGCTTTTTIGESSSTSHHIPEYRSCERVEDANISCEVNHKYEVSFLRHISGPTNIKSCGYGCVDLWIGRVGDNYLSGTCKVFEQSLVVELSNTRAIHSATLEYAKWDDYMQVLLNGTKVWQGHDDFPPETDGECELNTSWEVDPETDVTSHFRDGRLNFLVRASVSGEGEAYGRIRIKYDPTKIVENDIWYPQSCINKAQSAISSRCQNDITCVEGPQTSDFSRTVKVAGKGGEWLTVQFDLARGTWKTIAPTDGVQSAGSVEKVDMTEKCAVAGSDPLVARKTHWHDNPISSDIDTSVGYRVLELPTCGNGMVGVVQIQDTSTEPTNEWILAGEFTFAWEGIAPDTGFGSGCIMVDNELLCNDFLRPSPISGVNNFCNKVNVNSTCMRTSGTLDCYTDAHGVTQCPENAGTIENSCEALSSDPKCAFVRSECVEGATIGGACRIWDDIYDCGYDTDVSDYDVNTDISCGAEIRCMGEECMDPAGAKSNSFNRVAATMQIAKMTQNDGDCTDTVFADCQVFKGEMLECKKAVGGIQDCCFNASGISWLQYMELARNTYKIDNLIMGLDDTSTIRGAWSELREPIVDTWSSIQEGWTSATESITGTTEGGFDLGIGDAIEGFKDTAMEYAYDFVGDVFGETAQNALFSNPTTFNPMLTNLIGTIMWVYTIYAVVKLIIELVFPCTEEEYELSSKRATRACHRIGSYCRTKALGVCIEKRTSYCCYNSPLSRIINEQTRLQGIGTWGSPSSPNCSGLSITEMGVVDWDRVDLSEWIGMLDIAGQLPDPTQYSIETLTGQGSVHDFSPEENPRSNVVERTNERMGTLDYQDILGEAKDGASTNVPSDVIPEM